MNCWSECFSFVFTLAAILLQISATLIPRIYLLNESKIQIGLLESCAVDSKCVVHIYMLDWFIKNLVLVIMSSIFLSLSMIFQIFECFCKNSKLNKSSLNQFKYIFHQTDFTCCLQIETI